nr:MAG TPA: hypothetical protein [Caudoviricetes sp.]DAI74251.1 MAG TPA: hypothetical protein [Caudoviricetes sp.]DAL84599.1 MAG TPA: hypothetical protein [Caudoviricetes sp.]DAO17618.1 MAG TPA: hypothetical protein [Caudoviricetes sp.]
MLHFYGVTYGLLALTTLPQVFYPRQFHIFYCF